LRWIVRKAYERDLLTFYIQIGGRKLCSIAAGILDAEFVERATGTRAARLAKIAGVVIRHTHDIETGRL